MKRSLTRPSDYVPILFSSGKQSQGQRLVAESKCRNFLFNEKSNREVAMSPLTLFIAKLIGLLFLAFSLLMVMNKRDMLAAINELIRSRGLMLIGGSINLAAGLAIILGHNLWHGSALTVVITLIGWFATLRGAVWLFVPRDKLIQFYETLRFERFYYVATAITGLLGLYLTVAGFAG
jgi:hypothetical protein